VLFVVDMRPEDAKQLSDDLIYKMPWLEIVPVRSGPAFISSMREHLEYYGLLPTARPSDVAEALRMFRRRYPNVIVLDRAESSAAQSAVFEDPRLALLGLHFLPRIYVDLADAKRRAPKQARHNDFKLVYQPPRDLLRGILQNAHFDLSDSDEAHIWTCPDGLNRDFGWHL
jgi:hypothetical protein